MWSGAVTNVGVALLKKWATGGTLTITKAQSGSGFVNTSQLAAQAALTNPVQTLTITGYQTGDTGVTYRVQILAHTVEYTLRQIGIFAKLDAGAETLIAIFEDETGLTIPSSADVSDFVFSFSATVQMANTGSLTVNMDTSALVSRSEMEAYVAEALAGVDISAMDEHIANKQNPHEVTYTQTGAAAAQHYHGNLTPDGKVGSASGQVLRTGTGGAVTAGTVSALRQEMGLGDGASAVPVASGGTGRKSVTAGSFLVGNGTKAMAEKTPEEVREAIGAAATAHEHGNITSGGAIGSTADQAVMTGTSGKLVAVTPANARTKLDVYSKTEVQNYVTTQINAITDYEAVSF